MISPAVKKGHVKEEINKSDLISCMFFLCAIPASAQSLGLTEEEHIILEFENLGINAEKAAELARRYMPGEVLDCMKEDYSAIQPIKRISENGLFTQSSVNHCGNNPIHLRWHIEQRK